MANVVICTKCGRHVIEFVTVVAMPPGEIRNHRATDRLLQIEEAIAKHEKKCEVQAA